MIATYVLLMLMLPLSLYLLVRNPFNGATVVAVLSWVFGVLPGLFYVETRIIPSYSWRNMTYVGGPLLNRVGIESALLDLAIMTAAFTLGCLIAELMRNSRPGHGPTARPTNKLVSAALIGIWAISAVYFFALSGWRVDLFLLPIRQNVDESGYMKTIFMMVPLALFVQAYWNSGKLDRVAISWALLALFVAFSRPQRRDLVSIAMFIIAFLPLMRIPIEERLRNAAAIATNGIRSRAIAIAGMATALALVPALWYSRVFFTASEAGQNIDPTRIRSFTEILLGSPATGYPTFLLVERHVANHGYDPLHTISYLSTIFIPRSLWQGKPTDIDNVLEAKYQLIENPSIFWFGELYYGFGVFAIPLSLLLGFGFYSLASKAATSPSLLARTMAAVIFMHSITLFKNGISHFFINAAVIVLLVLFVWLVPAQRSDRYRDALNRS